MSGNDSGSSKVKMVAGAAGKRVLAALERADEIGGEVRDWLTERLNESERAQLALQKVRALRKRNHADVAAETRERMRAASAERQAVEADEAPPPTKAQVAAAERTGLGDPSLPAQIYGRTSCPWTGRAITLLEKRKTDYDYIDLDDEDNTVYETQLVAETKQNTVPYIYLRGEFVGGYNALDELERLGQLEFKLMTPEEQESANPAFKKVVVAQRPNTDERAAGEVEEGPR